MNAETRIYPITHVSFSSHIGQAVRIINALPEGSKVGLEITPEDLKKAKEGHVYWPIIQAARTGKHKLVPLESKRLEERYLTALHNVVKSGRNFAGPAHLKLENQRNEERKQMEASALRSEHMQEKILGERPVVSFIGGNHGRHFREAGHRTEHLRQWNPIAWVLEKIRALEHLTGQAALAKEVERPTITRMKARLEREQK